MDQLTTGTVSLVPLATCGFTSANNCVLIPSHIKGNDLNRFLLAVAGKIGNKSNNIGLKAYFVHDVDQGEAFIMNGDEGELSFGELKRTAQETAQELGLLH